jgi:hypothetical protein
MTPHSDSSLVHSPQHPVVYRTTCTHSTTAFDVGSSFSLTCGQTPGKLNSRHDLFHRKLKTQLNTQCMWRDKWNAAYLTHVVSTKALSFHFFFILHLALTHFTIVKFIPLGTSITMPTTQRTTCKRTRISRTRNLGKHNVEFIFPLNLSKVKFPLNKDSDYTSEKAHYVSTTKNNW